MHKLRKILLSILTAVALALPVSSWATNGYFAHGYGTKNKGLAGSGVALPQDAMQAATNPAGMVWVGKRYDIGGAVFSPSPRSYDATGGSGGAGTAFTVGPQSIESDNDFFLIPHFGRNWMLSDNSSIGLTIYGNGGMNTEYQGGTASFQPAGTLPGTFGSGTTGVDLSQLFIVTTYARKFSEKSSWGVSGIVAYQQFSATGLANFAPHSNDSTNLSNNGTDTSIGFGIKLGIQTKITPSVTFGASYQSEIDMEEFDKYKGLFAENGDFDIPATYTIGIAWKLSPKSVLTVDIQEIKYGDIKAIANPISGLTSPTGCGQGAGDTTQCLGGSNGAGFGWEDMTIIKVGYQWQTSPAWTWRVGFSQGDQPIPDSETLFNILAPAVIEQHITFGFTRKTGKDSELNFTAMHALNNSVSGTSAFDSAQTIKIEMKQFEAEVSWAKKF